MLDGAFIINAQEKLIVGQVTSTSDNFPLPGVNFFIKNSNKGIQTDFDGLYKITANSSDTLIFSYVGFVTQEILVGKLNTISVALEEDISCLDEIVVIGYETSNKRYIKGAVTTVSAAQAERRKQKALHNKLA